MSDITKTKVAAIKKELDAAIAKIAEKHGLTYAKTWSTKYDATQFNFQVRIIQQDEDSDDIIIGRMYHVESLGEVRVVGHLPRARRPWVIETQDGRNYRVGKDYLLDL